MLRMLAKMGARAGMRAATTVKGIGSEMARAGWNSLAYAERYQSALMTQRAVGSAMDGIGNYLGGAPAPGAAAAPFAIPLDPLAAQIKNEWAATATPVYGVPVLPAAPAAPPLPAAQSRPQQPPSQAAMGMGASVSQGQAAVPSPQTGAAAPVPAPLQAATPKEAPKEPPKEALKESPKESPKEPPKEPPREAAPEDPRAAIKAARRVRGAPIVARAMDNPIAPHHEKEHPEAHARIGSKYTPHAAAAIGELARVEGHEDTLVLARRASDLLTECIVAIEMGQADERHYHAIEMLQTVAPILHGIKHKEQ